MDFFILEPQINSAVISAQEETAHFLHMQYRGHSTLFSYENFIWNTLWAMCQVHTNPEVQTYTEEP